MNADVYYEQASGKSRVLGGVESNLINFATISVDSCPINSNQLRRQISSARKSHKEDSKLY